MTTLKRFTIVLTAAGALALTSPALPEAIDPPPEEQALTRMATLMDAVHRSMQGMRDDMRGTPHMGAMHDRMDRAMGMSDEMRTLMRQYQRQRHSGCAGGPPAAPPTERR